MKKIEIIIKPFEIDALKDKLDEIGIKGITVTEVKTPHKPKFPVGKEIDFSSKFKIEIVVPDYMAEEVIEEACEILSAESEVFTINVEEAIRIRTGETGEEAL